jgi:hypothetical protein
MELQKNDEMEEGSGVVMLLLEDGDVALVLDEGDKLSDEQIEFLEKLSCIQEPSLVLCIVLWLEVRAHRFLQHFAELFSKERK